MLKCLSFQRYDGVLRQLARSWCESVSLQEQNEDTEWNDILRSKGILPPKEPEITEESIVKMIEQTIEDKQNESKFVSMLEKSLFF